MDILHIISDHNAKCAVMESNKNFSFIWKSPLLTILVEFLWKSTFDKNYLHHRVAGQDELFEDAMLHTFCEIDGEASGLSEKEKFVK